MIVVVAPGAAGAVGHRRHRASPGAGTRLKGGPHPVDPPRVVQLDDSSDATTVFAAALGAARDGAPWACRHLYDSLAGRVCGYLRAHGARDPEDLTSEAFMRVFDHLDRFDGGEPQFRAWVFTIAHRLLIDDHRRRAVRPQTTALSPSDVECVGADDVERDAMAGLGDTWVAECFATLSPDQRAVLSLRIVGDLTVDQVARTLDKTPGTVKALQRRGLAALRRSLERTPA